MRPISTALVIAGLLASVTTFSDAQAASPLKPWLAGYGSWGTYAMGDVNDAIGNINAELAGTGLSMDKVQNGFGFGLEAGLDLQGFALGVGYERLTASTDVGNAEATIEFKLPANAFYGLAEYKLPTPGPVGARLGLGAGIVSLAGEEKLSVTGLGSASTDITGTGPMFKVYGNVEVKAAPRLSVLGSLGYRYAKVSKGDVKVDLDRSILAAYGPGFAVDHSGVFLRAGVKVGLLP